MKHADRENDMRLTQGLLCRSQTAEPVILKYRPCRKAVYFLVHFPTVMPQSSIRRILGLQIFHKNNKLQSFSIIEYVTVF